MSWAEKRERKKIIRTQRTHVDDLLPRPVSHQSFFTIFAVLSSFHCGCGYVFQFKRFYGPKRETTDRRLAMDGTRASWRREKSSRMNEKTAAKCSSLCIFSFSRLHSPFLRRTVDALRWQAFKPERRRSESFSNVSNVRSLQRGNPCHKHAQWIESIAKRRKNCFWGEKKARSSRSFPHCFAYGSSAWCCGSIRALNIIFLRVLCWFSSVGDRRICCRLYRRSTALSRMMNLENISI